MSTQIWSAHQTRNLVDKDCIMDQTKFLLVNIDTNRLNYYQLRIIGSIYKTEDIIAKGSMEKLEKKITELIKDYFEKVKSAMEAEHTENDEIHSLEEFVEAIKKMYGEESEKARK